MALDTRKISEAQGLSRAVDLAQAVIDATDHTRIIVQFQGMKGAASQAQYVVLDSDPEFAQMTSLVKAVAARRQTDQKAQLDTAVAVIAAAAPKAVI